LKLNLAEQAATDLRLLIRYGEQQWGTQAARSYAADVRTAFSLLRDRPRIGSVAEGLPDGFRRWSVRSHIIYYQLQSGDLVVLRILHASQNAIDYLT